MLVNDRDGDGAGDNARGDVVAGLSPGEDSEAGEAGASGASGVSGVAGVELAGDTGGADADAGQDGGKDDAAGVGPVVVSVQGLVHRPGLVTVDAGTRAGEVIDRSGGVRGDGRVEGINLAEPVVDGMQIVVDPEGSRVLYPGERGEPAQQRQQTQQQNQQDQTGSTESTGLVNINTADATGLTTLSGVGPATAEAIIAWREANGSFAAVEQLMEVKGIGPAKFEALRDGVTV